MKSPPPALASARLARLPASSLAALAPLRTRPGIRVEEQDEHAWIHWDETTAELIACLLPIRGIEFYRIEQQQLYRLGEHLPDFDAGPLAGGRPLDRVLFPAPVAATGSTLTGLKPLTLRLVRDGRPRESTALRASLPSLRGWIDRVSTASLRPLMASMHAGQIWIRGRPLPLLPGSERFWGDRLLVPLGFRPEPDWPVDALREVCGVSDGELLILEEAGGEIIPLEAFAPLSRAAVRKAIG